MNSKLIKTFYIKNLGCAKNKCDGDKIAEFLEEKGLSAEVYDKADLIIVNTCGFIESSRDESIETFFALYNSKKKSAKIVIAGCMAQRYYNELSDELKEADFILGNYDIRAIVDIVDELNNQVKSDNNTDKVRGIDKKSTTISQCYNSKHIAYANNNTKGRCVYIKIAEGCTHRCSYCAIPLIRGTLVSLETSQIVKNIKGAVRNGAIEINLVAQDLINYGKDRSSKTEIYDLLDKVCQIDGDFKIRLLYIHPDFFELELVKFVASTKGKILPYYDIPIQHVNRDILQSMGRKGDAKTYSKLFNSIREIDEKSIIRTTFMLGYPLETKATLKELNDFINLGLLDYAGFFLYSREIGTRSYDLGVSKLSKKALERAQEELSIAQEEVADKCFSRFVGRNEKAIIDDYYSDEDTYIARIWAQALEVDGITSFQGNGNKVKYNIGDIVNLNIKSNDSYDLFGELM